jgi:hypothetical protein
MQGGKDKKLTVFTKNIQAKKPTLEIDVNNEHESNKMASTHPQPAHNDDGKIGTTLTSPSNFKLAQQGGNSDQHEADPTAKKLPMQPMQKKTSLK